MSRINRGRRSSRRIAVLAALAAGALVLSTATPGLAARTYTSWALWHTSVAAKMTVAAKASATVTISATVSGYSASSKVTAVRTAKATARAWADGHARVKATATSKSRARARARNLARVLARHRAVTRARSMAHSRAYASARAAAVRYAKAAAKAAATSRAKAAAAAKAKAATPSTPVPTCAGPKIAKSTGGYWSCTFDDEFSQSKVDASKWVPITTASSATIGGGACFLDSPNNISEGGGYLTLTVRKEAAPITCQMRNDTVTTQYTAGQVATYTKFAQTYGRFAVRASFPAAQVVGLQSALWLWPTKDTFYGGTWPQSGEIDIAESYSTLVDRAIPYVHYMYDPLTVNTATNSNIVTNNYCLLGDLHAFHEYVVEWTPTTITILFDGRTCLVDHYTAASPLHGSAPFDQPFFLALTQSLGVKGNSINPALTPLPSSTKVDWVRIWK